jgi:hypothetical protein
MASSSTRNDGPLTYDERPILNCQNDARGRKMEELDANEQKFLISRRL